ncbi:MAG: hypothetical protein EXR72_01695 [Myxococcales bacterium]|nr:hypothetical protein [Myxococcales bacterium]
MSSWSLWLKHAGSLLLPTLTLLFVATGPHVWWASLLWLPPVVAAVLADRHPRPSRAQPGPDLPAGRFNAILYLAQLWNRRFREYMAGELPRRRLGPFAPPA